MRGIADLVMKTLSQTKIDDYVAMAAELGDVCVTICLTD